MGLSSELASQFAKVTNDSIRNTSGTKLYGTITMLGEVPYVRLDGTEELTPISRTVEVAEGDRVEVMIANHSATVTGNLTDPSIGIVRAGNLESKITQTAEEIRLEVSDLSQNLQSNITQTATEIRSEISGLNGSIEEFSEFKQTVEGFSFMGTGGTVKISGGDINLTGAISFSDLSDSETKQAEIDAIEATADSALSTANSASSTANNAYNVATSISIPNYIKSTYIDATTIKSPEIEGNNIKVYGTFQTVGNNEIGQIITGYMGAAQGLDENGNITYGVAIARTWDSDNYNVSNSYVIVTNAGVRLQYDSNNIVVSNAGIWLNVNNGKAYYNDVEIGSGTGSSIVAVWG